MRAIFLEVLCALFIVAFMKLAARRLSIFILFVVLIAFTPVSRSFAQGVQISVEDFKRLAGDVADLKDANAAYQRRITQMQKEIDSLREAVRESGERTTTKLGEFTTREDLKKMADKIQEVDQRREADRKLVLDEFDKLEKTLAQPVEKPERSSSRKRDRDREKEKDSTPDPTPAAPIEGTFYPYKVQDGQRLSDIIRAFNTKLKDEGRPSISMEQVKRANPKLNPNRILVGQEILLPVPDKKK
jgi:TolA-binding protein